MSLELKIARRYLRTKKKEGMISIVAALSIIGIALGVATLIIVLSVMNGFRTDLLARILGVNSHVSVYSYQRGIPEYQQLMKQLEADPQVALVTPTIEGNAVVYNPKFKERVDGVKIRGVEASKLMQNKLLNNDKFNGKFANFRTFEDAQDGILIGSKMAAALGVYTNDEITVITPQSSSTVFGSIPKKKTFRIAGVFDIGMNEYDRYMMYMPLDAAQNLFSFGDSVESLGVEMKDVSKSLDFAKELDKKIGNNYRIVDWQMANSSFFGAVQVERNVMFIILTMIVLVASFNIISSMVMLVKDKSGSIAILRTMGMARSSVMRIFIMVGSFNGIVGTVSGLILGLLFCFNIEHIQSFVEWASGTQVFNPEIYFLTKVPAQVNWGEVGQVAGISLVISLLATIYPSWRAARVQPAEILRYE
jgi:lipoprotein-releasing system permease protein